MSQAKNKICLAINSELIEVPSEFANLNLAEFLRNQKQLKGTKVVCEEGDCGACTVLIRKGNPPSEGKPWPYVAVNSCILFMFQLHGTHVITVDAFNSKEKMHPVQKSLFQAGASQCGFCTPGFTMHMIQLCEANTQETGNSPSQVIEKSTRDLCGNLCRCTGYAPIYEALTNSFNHNLSSVGQAKTNGVNIHQYEDLYRRLDENSRQSVTVKNDVLTVFIPATLNEALAQLNDNSPLRIVSGATDLGVPWNKSVGPNKNMLILPKDGALTELKIENSRLIIGAMVNLSTLEQFLELQWPEVTSMLEGFASRQIKNLATVAGNIINASPIGDTLPWLYLMDAEVELKSFNSTRHLAIDAFITGYRKTQLQDNELLTQIRVPVKSSQTFMRLYKCSRRQDLDISCIHFAGLIEGDRSNIQKIKFTVGGMGPTILHLQIDSSTLLNQPFDRVQLQTQAESAITSLKPMSDARGSKDFRTQLCKNMLNKFLDEFEVSVL